MLTIIIKRYILLLKNILEIGDQEWKNKKKNS
jgi:hypothetical protein